MATNTSSDIRRLLPEYYEFLSRCIKEDLGFKDGKPLAACIIYRCLLHWHAFESGHAALFDYIIQGINDVIKVGDESATLPYWLSNSSALLCLLQRNMRSNDISMTTSQKPAGSTAATWEGSTFVPEDGITRLEAKCPAILFKQQLTACVEKIFDLIRDNLKKELSPLLRSCVQLHRAGRSSRSPGGIPQQSSNAQWDNITNFMDSLVNRLRKNYVPSFLIRKLVTQVFSFINKTLFNGILLRGKCCTFSYGEYVKSGLAELEKWIGNAKEKHAGTSWHKLTCVRQAVEFLVTPQKGNKSLDEIRHDICPALTVQQIYRICTRYWDDKQYETQSVSSEAVFEMREIMWEDDKNLASNSLLLDDDLSIPFSTEDIDMAIPAIDPSGVEVPSFLSEYACVQFLVEGPR